MKSDVSPIMLFLLPGSKQAKVYKPGSGFYYDKEILANIFADRSDKSLLKNLEAALNHSRRLYKLALTVDQAHGLACVSPNATRETLSTIS